MNSDDTIRQVGLDETLAATDASSAETPRAASQQRTRMEESLALESENALAHEERERTRRVVPFMAGLSVFAAAGLPFFGGTLWAKRLLQCSLGLGVLSMLWLWWRATTNQKLADNPAAIAWGTGFLCTCTNTIYFGIYSPAPAIMVMSLVILSMGRSRNFAIWAFVTASATEAGIGILDSTGIMADPGILTAESLSTLERVAGQVLVQSLLVAAFVVGRSSRRATTDAIEKMQDALLEVARRDVIANEAQDKVRRVLNIGGAGRYTSTTCGNYRLAEVIGHGGMGEVYRAVHVDTEEHAAVKVIHPHLVQNEEFLKRFLREVKLSSSANSPYVVDVLETGQAEAGPYLAMELLSGIDLSAHLSRTSSDGPMPLDHLQCLADQIGAGLDTAAAAGIVHRDIKPQNIFLSGGISTKAPPMHCKILDFGVARAMSGDATITKSSGVMGTPGYMAPEQANGRPSDHRADLHALAGVLYRACTGLPPFSGESAMSVMLSVIKDTPRPVSEFGLPPSLDAFFAKGFEKDPNDRYQSGADLSAALAMACAQAAA